MQSTKVARDTVMLAVRNARDSSKRIRITFKPDATTEVANLFIMTNEGTIELNSDEAVALETASESGSWSGKDRTATVAFTKYADASDEELFVEKMHGALEKIEVVP